MIEWKRKLASYTYASKEVKLLEQLITELIPHWKRSTQQQNWRRYEKRTAHSNKLKLTVGFTVRGFPAVTFLRPVRRREVRPRTRAWSESKHTLQNDEVFDQVPLTRVYDNVVYWVDRGGRHVRQFFFLCLKLVFARSRRLPEHSCNRELLSSVFWAATL